MAKEEKKGVELLTIEELRDQMKVPLSVLEGLKRFKVWSEGKKVSKVDFENALKSFSKSPIKGSGK